MEVGRELGAPISLLPLPVRFAEYAEYLALKGVLDDARVTRLVELAFDRIEKLFDLVYGL